MTIAEIIRSHQYAELASTGESICTSLDCTWRGTLLSDHAEHVAEVIEANLTIIDPDKLDLLPAGSLARGDEGAVWEKQPNGYWWDATAGATTLWPSTAVVGPLAGSVRILWPLAFEVANHG